jgi:RHS repeat-associated protein
VVATYAYDAYGNLTTASGTATTPLLFQGQYYDQALGAYDLRARWYDPGSAQFLSVDPLVAATETPFGYAGGDPVNFSDPTGLWGWNPISDVTQAAEDVGHYVAKHKAAITEIAIGVVFVVGATVLTAGLGDALLAAGAASVEESAAASSAFVTTGEVSSLWGAVAPFDLAVHAPFVLAPGLTVGIIGSVLEYAGIKSLVTGNSGLPSASACGS